MSIVFTVLFVVILIVTGILTAGWVFTRSTDKKIEREFQPPGSFTPVSGGEIHYTQQGSGPALILIHGLAGNALNFSRLATLLSEHYTVYCIDRPGSGFSTRNNTTSASFEVQSRMILEWMSKVGIDEAYIAGHSMGGAISLRLALDAPEKIKAITLLAALTVPSKEGAGPLTSLYIPNASLRRLIANTIASPLRIKWGTQLMDKIFYPEKVPLDFASKDGGALALHSSNFYHASCDIVASISSLYKQFKQYNMISCPLGILYGTDDAILNPSTHMPYITQSCPNSVAETIPNAGHMLPVTQPKACVAFINKVNGVTQ